MPQKQILCDENIPLVSELFSAIGEVHTVSGRTISAETVRDFDALIVRSVTPVTGQLLRGSSVQFVATATIGTDHIDQQWLAENHIAFCAAPGSNAQSVAEYVAAALLHCASDDPSLLRKKTAGIIGFGNVGRRVARVCSALGIHAGFFDPFVQEELYGAKRFLSLEQLIEYADIITVHVPLTDHPTYPTRSMVNNTFLQKIARGTWFVNTSRGGVVDELALREKASDLGAIVLDVWQNEPGICSETLQITRLATPHIAGYSWDGKIAGAAMVARQCARYFGIDVQQIQQRLPTVAPIPCEATTLGELVRCSYDIAGDDTRLRRALSAEDPLREFDQLRKNYPRRYEFAHYTAKANQFAEPLHREIAEKLGFGIVD